MCDAACYISMCDAVCYISICDAAYYISICDAACYISICDAALKNRVLLLNFLQPLPFFNLYSVSNIST